MASKACKVTEITPAMIEAGAAAVDSYLFEHNPEALPMGPYSSKDMARKIFEAMARKIFEAMASAEAPE